MSDEQGFAGELFLTLATEGRLVLDPCAADDAIAGLERTLDVLLARLQLVRTWEHEPHPPAGDLAPGVVDAVFAEQLAPGRIEQAVRELPKYIHALHLARRPAA